MCIRDSLFLHKLFVCSVAIFVDQIQSSPTVSTHFLFSWTDQRFFAKNWKRELLCFCLFLQYDREFYCDNQPLLLKEGTTYNHLKPPTTSTLKTSFYRHGSPLLKWSLFFADFMSLTNVFIKCWLTSTLWSPPSIEVEDNKNWAPWKNYCSRLQ